MMPLDCKNIKHNKYQAPPYDAQSYAYRNRRDIECTPKRLMMLYNCGSITRPSTHSGIMGLEKQNNTLNRFDFALGTHGIVKASTNAEVFVCANNIDAYQYWKRETGKPKRKRIQPQYPTFVEMYPDVFQQIAYIITNTLNLELFINNFKHRDGTTRMMTIIDADRETLKNEVYDMIFKNCLTFSNKNNKNWSDSHNLHLWILLKKYKYFNKLNEKKLKKLYKYFNQKFDVDFLFERCRAMGTAYNV